MNKALKLQQETEDRKNKFIISKLENKVENLQGSL
jgi:predicted RNase H-like nuclease (RuvC/YqgF family)